MKVYWGDIISILVSFFRGVGVIEYPDVFMQPIPRGNTEINPQPKYFTCSLYQMFPYQKFVGTSCYHI